MDVLGDKIISDNHKQKVTALAVSQVGKVGSLWQLCTSEIKASTSPRAFDPFSCPGGRAFDHHSWGVGNLIASLNVILRVMG